MDPKSERFDKFMALAAFVLVAAALVSCYSIFYVRKNFDFLVEAPCDASKQSCFVRDCSTGDCPPNGLSEYRTFNLKAADFHSCSDDSCLAFCTANTLRCTETICGDDPSDTCSVKP